MILDTENLIYHLIIELEATIDNVLLQCDCLVNLIDFENNNTAVVSKSKCKEEVSANTYYNVIGVLLVNKKLLLIQNRLIYFQLFG